ncbi:MAG TPA: hypothetical protein VKA67_04515, partial [Verrucomicrobiae bacterium]|nr:hypothetical protein [Verrucomicrobiae bacterium]
AAARAAITPPPIVRKKGSTDVIRMTPRPVALDHGNEVAAFTTTPSPVAMPPSQSQPVPAKPVPDEPTPIPVTPALQDLAASGPSFKAPAAAPAPAPASEPTSPKPIPFALQPLTPEPAPEPPREVPTLPVALASLAKAWPESLRQEIAQSGLQDANVNLPEDKVELALKQGKVTFAWRVLRSWIQPPVASNVSVNDATAVELPLDVLAPLFLTRQRAASTSQRKVAIDENIPNLFFGFPQTDAQAAPPVPETGHAISKPVDTNYYVWDDTSDTVHLDASEYKRPAPSLETTFTSRCATPNEIVSRAAALEGIAGALVALPDGLMVANQIPPNLNGDTLAAFLPHIFGKVSQCTKELRMGELNNLNFTVGNVPWKIFRVNAIFFAAFGRAGEPLPTAQLAALAAELDRKKTN